MRMLLLGLFVSAPLLAAMAEPGMAQTSTDERQLSNLDLAARILYLVDPRLGRELKQTLLADEDSATRSELLRKFSRHVDEVIEAGRNLPEQLRDPRWDSIEATATYAMRIAKGESDVFHLGFPTEDDIIKRLNLPGYEELYDFLRDSHDDFGYEYIKRLAKLRWGDVDDKLEYLDELGKLLDDLRAYRARKKGGRTVRVKPGDVVAIEDRPAGAKTTKTASPSDRESPDATDKDVKPEEQRGDEKDD